MKKSTVKYQLIRDGELYNTVYNHSFEAAEAGQLLIECGWIKSYDIKPIQVIWLKG